MSNENSTGSVTIERYLDKEREAIFAIGNFEALHEAYDSHASVWEHDDSPLTNLMMRQALAGCALYHSCRPLDETSAFTLNICKPPTNIFVTGSASDRRVTGRPWVAGVKDLGMNRLYVQTQRAKGADSTSVIDVAGIDVLVILEEYCRRSDQAPAKFFDLEDNRFLMVASLPKKDRMWLEGLDRETAVKGIEGLALLDEKEFWFQCGCDPKRLAKALRQMYAGKGDEFFAEDETLKAQCPRCGRHWQIRRDLFDGEDE
ncbi:MAG: hypothetical protein ACI97A_000349 [Planctomycetota bacterium]|jgi:hypothetical protein